VFTSVHTPFIFTHWLKLWQKTCHDIFDARADLYILSTFKAVHLPWLLAIHLGIGSNDVAPGTREERRSIGAERTFSTLTDRERIMGKLEEVVNELYEDMKKGGWVGRTITLKYKLDTFQVFTRAKSFDRWISSREDLLQVS
jgi:DNA polymerase kappa